MKGFWGITAAVKASKNDLPREVWKAILLITKVLSYGVELSSKSD